MNRRIAKDYWEKERPHTYPQSLEYSEELPHLGARLRKYWIEELFKEIVQCETTPTFLDVGCAEGLYIRDMAFHSFMAVGIDFSVAYLKRAKARSHTNSRNNKEKISFVLADAENLPFRENSFDIVLCSEVLEHLPNWRKCVAESAEVCKKYLIVSFPPSASPFERLRKIMIQLIRPRVRNRRPGEDFFYGRVTLRSILHEAQQNSFCIKRKINSHPIFSFLQTLSLLSFLDAVFPTLAKGLANIVEKLDKDLGYRQNSILEMLSGSIIVGFARAPKR